MVRQIIAVFFGKFNLASIHHEATEIFNKLKEPSWLMKGPLIVLSFFCFWFVFSPNPISALNSWVFKIEAGWITLIISLLLTLSGILAGILFYFKIKKASYKTGPIGNYIRSNWYMDQIYYITLVKPGIAVSDFIAWIDRKIIDGFIHFFAISGVAFAHIIAWFDRVFVDGIVHFTAWIASKAGGMVRSLQVGRVQSYFITALFIILILIIWIIIA
jgi:NADH-quinone oxidoreductase subunit L